MSFILPFSEVCKSDVAHAGGKGANLGELIAAGAPVPPGFVLTTQAYSRFLDDNGLRPQIERLLAPLDLNDSARLSEASSAIKNLITTAVLPSDIEEPLLAAYLPLSGSPV